MGELMGPAAGEEEGNGSEDSEAAVDEAPGEGDAAEGAHEEGEGDDEGAGEQTEVEKPAVADGIAPGAEEGEGDDEMAEGEPVVAVGEEGVAGVGVEEGAVDGGEPGEERVGLRLGRIDVEELEEGVHFGFERDGGQAAEGEAKDEEGEGDADAAEQCELRSCAGIDLHVHTLRPITVRSYY